MIQRLEDHNNAAKQIWSRLYDAQQAQNWRDYASCTIPSVCNELGKRLRYDYQSTGALLVNSLSARLAQILFPPNSSFFKLSAGASTQDQRLEQALADIELNSSQLLFNNASYAQLIYALQLLIITGNALLVRSTNGFKVHNPLEYVVDRGLDAEVRSIVIKQTVQEQNLTEHARTQLNIRKVDYLQQQGLPQRTLDLYTLVWWDPKDELWYEEQYVDDIAVHEKQGKYPKNLCPYIPVRWSARNGEWFGRGHVEAYAGDFMKLSKLSRALADYEDGSTNVKLLVAPNSMVDVQELNSGTTGLFVFGEPKGVEAFEFGDAHKIQVLQQSIAVIQQRLSIAFMQSSNQRQGERVTAYEVQLAAQEAESTLGGVYSLLSQSLHLPLAYLLCSEIDTALGVELAKGALDVHIITGVQALSRSSELQQWVQLTQELGLIIPTLKQVSPRFNTERIIERFMLGHGISREFLYTEEQMQTILQEQLQQLQQTQYQERNITSQDAANEAVEQLGVI